MILSGKMIRERLGGDIIIDPFDTEAPEPEQLQPDAARRDHDLRRSRA